MPKTKECGGYPKPPSTGWYCERIDKYCANWLASVSLGADLLCQTRFREWYGGDLPRIDPVMIGYLYADVLERPAYPIEDLYRLRTVDEMEELQPKFPPLSCSLAWKQEKAPGAWHVVAKRTAKD